MDERAGDVASSMVGVSLAGTLVKWGADYK